MKTLLLCVLALVCSCHFAFAQKNTKRESQYKRVHQDALTSILGGDDEKAIELLNSFLQEGPDDEETHYMLAVAHAHAGRTETAIAMAQKAIELGLPAERFLAGSRTLLEGLDGSKFITDLQLEFAHAPLHGPMLGNVKDNSASIWVRVAPRTSVRVVAAQDAKLTDGIASETKVATAATDYTVVLELKGLSPSTDYFYQVEVDGEQHAGGPYRLRTASTTHQPTKFRFAFGGGAGYVPFHERMWNTISGTKPDLLLLLGDNVYSDDPKTPEMQHFCYYRRQSRPEFRQLVSHTPVYSIWDDHDFGVNDCVEGPLVTEPPWKLPVFRVFRNNWVNPGYGTSNDQPGCYYDFYIGDVHFIMLDGRFYRTLEPTQGGPTMLGPVQRKWLLDTVQNGKGRLTMICSPVPWVFKAKGDSQDTWNGFRSERNEILEHFKHCRKEGVFLVSADRHRSDLWIIERPDGYPIYEFNSSRLTNQHVHKEMPNAEFSYNDKQSFGVVDIDTTIPDPTITYRILSIDSEEVFARRLRRSETEY